MGKCGQEPAFLLIAGPRSPQPSEDWGDQGFRRGLIGGADFVDVVPIVDAYTSGQAAEYGIVRRMEAYHIPLRQCRRDRPTIERGPQPGPKDVLMGVRGSSLNYRDLMGLKGGGRGPTKLGGAPLSDGAGEVAAIGERVTRVKMGDRIIGTFHTRWFG
jgi:hypothetical protein